MLWEWNKCHRRFHLDLKVSRNIHNIDENVSSNRKSLQIIFILTFRRVMYSALFDKMYF